MTQDKGDTVSVKVSVITRTKNRAIFLERALDSLSGQYLHRAEFEWIVVNDGGLPDPVDVIVDQARRRGLQALVVHRDKSAGMEAASNAGLNISSGHLFAIHDDDDTWEPAFLDATVNYLETHPEDVAVVTHSTQVDEVVEEGLIIERSRFPYNPGLASIQLADFTLRNHFPPISMLVRKEVIDRVGTFDESLPVLGDWDFVLRLLTVGEIGVLSQALANYHIRPSSGPYRNSLTAARSDHARYDAIIRNRVIRRDIDEGRMSLGQLLAIAQMHNFSAGVIRDQISRQEQMPGIAEALGHVTNQLSSTASLLSATQGRLSGTTASLENLLESVRSTLRKMPLLRSALVRSSD